METNTDVTVINMTGDADRTRCLVGEVEALLRVDVQLIEFDVQGLTTQKFGVDKLLRAVPDIGVVVIIESMYDIVDAACDTDSMILGLRSIEFQRAVGKSAFADLGGSTCRGLSNAGRSREFATGQQSLTGGSEGD